MADRPHPDSSRLRVLLAAPVPPPDHGGIANWTRIIRRELGGRPDVELTCLDTSVRWRSATNLALPVRLVGGAWQALRDTSRAIRQFRRRPPDVFHLCTSGGLAAIKDLLMLSAARAWGVSSVIHYRMGRLPRVLGRSGPEAWLVRRAARIADQVIVLDRSSEAAVRAAVPRARVARLANLVEIDHIDGLCRSSEPRAEIARIVYVGQVLPTKGVRELVTACGELADDRVRLELVGPVAADFREELHRTANAYRDGDWFRLHGAVAHESAIRHVSDCDVFVLPSYSEGFPNAVLEAMACGRPILASTVGAIPEMLGLDEIEPCGVGVPPRDVTSLKGGLQRLLADPGWRRELGRRARRRAASLYTANVVSVQLVDLWRTLAGHSPAPAARSLGPAA